MPSFKRRLRELEEYIKSRNPEPQPCSYCEEPVAVNARKCKNCGAPNKEEDLE